MRDKSWKKQVEKGWGGQPFKGYGWLRHLRDWTLALLIALGVGLGPSSPASANQDGCFSVEGLSADLDAFDAKYGEVPFAWTEYETGYFLFLVNPISGTWSFLTFHREDEGGPLVTYCLRGSTTEEEVTGYGAGGLPEEFEALRTPTKIGDPT